jgi:transposase-like protein
LPCPRCGSTEVSQAAEIPDVPPEPVEEWPSRVWRFRCAACHHTWLEDEIRPKDPA